MQLDDALIEFLDRPLMCILAAADRAGRPTAGRGVGFHVADDRESIDVIFSGWQWPQIEPAIREAGRLAVTFVSPSDYVSFQIKGQAVMRDMGAEDAARADQFMARATNALEALGVQPALIVPWLTARGARVARLAVSEIYVQTPGPLAGMRADARRP